MAIDETPVGQIQRTPPLLARLSLVLMIVYVTLATALITLRALVGPLDFLSVGWIILLALIPLLPWLIPALGPAVRDVAPFIREVKLPGGVEISLAAAERPVIGLGPVEETLTSDHLVHGLSTTATPFTTTDSMAVIHGVQTVRQSGAEAVLVDIGDSTKWRLPNLYFLTWILSNDPITRWMVLTETRGDISGFLIGMCAAAELRERIEVAYPAYAAVSPQLEYSDPARIQNQQQLADEFNKIRAGVAPPITTEEMPMLKWVSTTEVRDLLGPHLVRSTVDWTVALDRAGLETIINSNSRYVAAIGQDGRFRGLVDQREVVLEFARRVLRAP